ncbi:MAG: MYG1 family protein [Lachnospiraceae bacterium]
MSQKKISYEHGYTHAGSFHSDDVFATAFLRMLNPDIQIERGNCPPEDFDGIIYDIGGGKFDHHQKEKELREDGTPYAAFGLIWREFGALLFSEEMVEEFDEKFVKDLDLSDNTGSPNLIASVIADFNPCWDDKTTTSDERFFEAVEMAQTILQHKFERISSTERAKNQVLEAIQKSDGQILLLEEFMPWKKFVAHTTLKYAIYPSNRGGYSIQAIPEDEKVDEKEVLKLPFPEEWRGAKPEELQEKTGISTARFCHPSGFLAAADTLDGALAMAKISLAQETNQDKKN